MSPERGRARSTLARPERLLPFACIAAAIVLGASELATTFRLTAAGNEALCVQHGLDRHHFAQLLLAIFGGFATITAIVAGSRPAARAVAAPGVIALFLFFLIDLPHANNVGSISSACDLTAGGGLITAKAVPQGGFWLELIGALGLAVSGIALSTLTSKQLHSLRPRWLIGSGTEPDETPPGRKLLRSAGRTSEKGREAGGRSAGKRERPKRERPKRARPRRRTPRRTGDANAD